MKGGGTPWEKTNWYRSYEDDMSMYCYTYLAHAVLFYTKLCVTSLSRKTYVPNRFKDPPRQAETLSILYTVPLRMMCLRLGTSPICCTSLLVLDRAQRPVTDGGL